MSNLYVRLLIIATLVVAAPGVIGLSACSEESRYRALSFFFEEVPKPGEKREWKVVKREPRRQPMPTATPVAEVVIVERPEVPLDWLDQLLPKLPKDASGSPDLARSLNEKLIAPQAGIDPGTKAQPVFNMDVALEPKGQPRMKVVFSHKAHTQWLGCPNCHPGVFQMKKGSDPITMATIYAGKYCGACHGKVAFAVPSGCARCHRAMGGGK